MGSARPTDPSPSTPAATASARAATCGSLTTGGVPCATSTRALAPWAAAVPSASRRIASWARRLASGSKVRSVASQGHPLGDHVGGAAALDRAEREDHRGQRVGLAAHHGLQRHDHVGRRGHRVDALVRPGAVPGPSHHLDPHVVGRRRDGPRPGLVATGREARREVQPGDHPDPVERAAGQHRPGAALGTHLLGRLEQQAHLGRADLVAGAGQRAGGAQQHGGVPVVPAGVHDARNRRGVRQPGPLVDRQRVHVGSQGHHRPGPLGW